MADDLRGGLTVLACCDRQPSKTLSFIATFEHAAFNANEVRVCYVLLQGVRRKDHIIRLARFHARSSAHLLSLSCIVFPERRAKHSIVYVPVVEHVDMLQSLVARYVYVMWLSDLDCTSSRPSGCSFLNAKVLLDLARHILRRSQRLPCFASSCHSLTDFRGDLPQHDRRLMHLRGVRSTNENSVVPEFACGFYCPRPGHVSLDVREINLTPSIHHCKDMKLSQVHETCRRSRPWPIHVEPRCLKGYTSTSLHSREAVAQGALTMQCGEGGMECLSARNQTSSLRGLQMCHRCKEFCSLG